MGSSGMAGEVRLKALELLMRFNESEALVRHGIAVGAVLGHFAARFGEDGEYWEAVGLLHDVDYERWPSEHCKRCVSLLEEAGYDEAFIHAVVCHGYGVVCDVEPILLMEKVLYAIDELTGLIGAAALMRPSRSVLDIEVRSVLKKFKDRRFAAGVDRGLVLKGCDLISMELSEVIGECIVGMRGVAEEIGLG